MEEIDTAGKEELTRLYVRKKEEYNLPFSVKGKINVASVKSFHSLN